MLRFRAHVFFNPALTEWLMLHREGLPALLHHERGDDLLDHTAHAVWLGSPLELRLDWL